VGTQYQLARYIGSLHKSGFDFRSRVANWTTFEKYRSVKDRVERLVVQHGLV
jgi:hypothetical protein